MIKNYLKIAFRNFARNKGYTLINMFGLAISLACGLMILVWVQDEYQVNKIYENGDQIYQVFRNFPDDRGAIETRPACPYPVADALSKEFPEIDQATAYRGLSSTLIGEGKHRFLMKGAMAHFSIFDIFSLPVIEELKSDDQAPLDGIYISRKLAVRYFGDNWSKGVLGEMIPVDGGDVGKTKLQVLGVFEDLSDQSTLRFDFVTNVRKFARDNSRWTRWGSSAFDTYARLIPDTDPFALEKKVAGLVSKNGGPEQLSLSMQAFRDTYLYSQFENGQATSGRIMYVRIFFFAALFLILMACINFINLTTAQATGRAEEVGVRKVIGADKKALVAQFMTETGLITLVSIALAILICEGMSPWISELFGRSIELDFSSSPFWLMLSVISIAVIILAGSYPAFVLSSFSIMSVLKNKIGGHRSGQSIRKSLVVLQFVLAGLLMTAGLIVQQQINFIKNKNLGMDRDNLIQMRIPNELREKMPTFKNKLLSNPVLTDVSQMLESPLDIGRATDDLTWPGKDPELETRVQVAYADHDFLDAYKMELSEGRFYQNEQYEKDSASLVVNETAVALMNLDQPIGAKVFMGTQPFTIIGVIKDIHANSLHETIRPLMIYNNPEPARQLAIRYEVGKAEQAIAHLESTYAAFVNDFPLQFRFSDEEFEHMYQRELLINKLATAFALIAIFISCLGMLGLGAFMVKQKTKEIGIRKVLGASVPGIVRLLSQDFLKLVLLAFLIAAPISWYFMQQWLQDFAYRIDIHWGLFVLTAGGAVLITFLTIGFHSLKAALTNPVESLRNE